MNRKRKEAADPAPDQSAAKKTDRKPEQNDDQVLEPQVRPPSTASAPNKRKEPNDSRKELVAQVLAPKPKTTPTKREFVTAKRVGVKWNIPKEEAPKKQDAEEPLTRDEAKAKRLKLAEERKAEDAKQKEKERLERDDWMRKRFAHLSGSNVSGLTGRSFFGNQKKTTYQVFQIFKMSSEGEEYCRIGREEEPLTLRRAAEMWGFEYILPEGANHFIEHPKYPWLGTTVDQLTADACVEAKFKSKKRDQFVFEMVQFPREHLDQCMLHNEINKRSKCHLVIASDIDIKKITLAPSAAEHKTYWDETWPIYLEFYNIAMAWYWEQDLTRANWIVGQMLEDNYPWEAIGGLLQRAFTDKHAILVDGRLPKKPVAPLKSPVMPVPKPLPPPKPKSADEKKKKG